MTVNRRLWVVALLAACGPSKGPDTADDFADAAVFDASPYVPPNEFIDAGTVVCQKMDLLFVIDDSASMQDERGSLIASFPEFVRVLDKFRTSGGISLDYRIAVTTTSRDVDYFDTLYDPPDHKYEYGDNGEMLSKPECGMTRRWIERSDSDVTGAFSCVATTAPPRTLLEMPLLAMQWALDDRVADGTNAGFLRDDALLAIVILTDEEDCSREDNGFLLPLIECTPSTPELVPVSDYVQFLDDLKGGRDRWAAAVIADPPPTACSGLGTPGFRHQEFVDLSGNSVFSSICAADLSGSLRDALDTFDVACSEFPPIP